MKDCPVEGCQVLVKDTYLMCGLHWRRVPKDLQGRVYTTFRAWTRAGGSRADYVTAATAAIEAATKGNRS